METHSMFPALSSEPADALEARANQKEQLLLWLLMHPYQRCEDLAVAMGRHPSSTYRHLALLEARGLLEHVSISASQSKPQHAYYLTTDGIGAVAQFVGADPEQMARVWETDEAHLLRLLPRLPHLLTLQTLLNTMVTAAPTIWSYGPGQPAFIRWHWLRDLRLPFHLQGKRRQCRVDGALVWTRSPRRQHVPGSDLEYYSVLWLLDPGLVGPRDRSLMRHRLEALMLATGEHPPEGRPPILIITTTTRSVERWQRSAAEAAIHLHSRPLTGAVVVVPSDLSTTSPWTLSWQRLSPPGPCRLRDLCVPLPRETIPAGLLAPRTLPAGFFESPRRRQKQIVQGHFAQRAQTTQSIVSTLPPNDEEATALLALRLTPAHHEILQLLYAHPLLTSEEGAALLDLQVSSVRRRLSDLARFGCIQRHPTAYGMRMSLDERGLHLLSLILVVPYRHFQDDQRKASITMVQRGTQEVLQRLPHTVVKANV